MRQPTPWAVLLCHWSDDSSKPNDRQFFTDLFTSSGAGSLNMTDYFEDCTHGTVDMSGSQVFGWLDMGFDRAAYVGNAVPGPGQLDRGSMMAQAKAVASAAGVDLSQFFGVVVCFNVLTDLFGGIGTCCDPGSFRPALLGQEMGHDYGLGHSRREGSTADYEDRWDTMSTWNSCFIAGNARWTEVGPGLNAWNMRSRGWLDESRVWRSSYSSFEEVVELRPLHHRELPGLLAAELPGSRYDQPLLVEFRDVDRWDAAIPEPTVLVHRFADNHSYVMPGTSGSESLREGDAVQYGSANSNYWWEPYGRVELLGIDARSRTARIRLSHRPAVEDPGIGKAPGGRVFGAATVGGWGWISVNGHVHPVPPHSPLVGVLAQLAIYHAVEPVRNTIARNAARRSALEQVLEWSQGELAEIDELASPPPAVKEPESGY